MLTQSKGDGPDVSGRLFAFPKMSLRTLTGNLRMAFENLERRANWILGAVSLVYFGIIWILASVKPFWNDELFTFYISRLPSLSHIWNALLTGTEQLPPLFFVITRTSTVIFGHGLLAFRLPETIGFWIMMVSLYSFVRRRSSSAYGIVAMVFPLITEGLYYSYEARPYGIVLGFAGLALLSWQAAAEGLHRGLALVCLTVSLGAALSCHYYSILIFVPFAIGEAVRFASRKRIDLPVLAAIAAAVTPLVLFRPLIRAAHSYSSTFWAKPQWTNILGFYYYLLGPAVLLLVCVPMALVIGAVIHGSKPDDRSDHLDRIPKHEIAAAITFALLPLVAVFLAKTITGAFTNRYAITAVIGLSILLAWSLSFLGRNKPATGLLTAILGIALFSINGVKSYRDLRGWAANSERTLAYLRHQSDGGTPVVVADPHLFFELSSLGGEGGAPWLVYLADREMALGHTGTDTVELGLINFKQWAPLRVEDFRRYSEAQHGLLIYGYNAPFAWVAQELAQKGWHFEVKDMNAGRFLLFASRPETYVPETASPKPRSERE